MGKLAKRTRAAEASRGVVRVLPFEGDDEALLRGLAERQPIATATFCDRYSDHVKRVLGRILGADSELLDLHQEVFMKAVLAAAKLQDARNLRGWLTVIAVNRAKTELRKRARRRWFGLAPGPKEAPEAPAPGVDADAAEALERTYRLLDEMAADDRIVFTLRIIDGMELSAVAAACDVSLATIKRRLQRAQSRFVQRARRDEVLRDWLQEGGRWS